MGSKYQYYSEKIDELSLRERLLITITMIVVILMGWYQFYEAKVSKDIADLSSENEKLQFEIKGNKAIVDAVKQKVAAGADLEKNVQVKKLRKELELVKERLRQRTIALIAPNEMFNLMAELIYKESGLKLLSLKRREVRQAILAEDSDDDLGVYRHVLEINFSGKFKNIQSYIAKIEALDWQLIWDEIELDGKDYPAIKVKIVFSTLSTKKEWVGV